MNNLRYLIACSLFSAVPGAAGLAAAAEQSPDVAIVVGREATPVEQLAARELCSFLTSMYPKNHLTVADQRPSNGASILIGTRESNPALAALVSADELKEPGRYVVRAIKDNGPGLAVIAGTDARAVLHGVYGLLEHLGCGFYLSFNSVPAFPDEPLNITKWELVDAPVVAERIVFNWHNFLSSCSTWNLPEWQAWIDQVARMRYTAVMVHAYGNNPMVCFSHNGQTKPVGYLTTTVKGRDWGTQHVNDVRLLHGGDVFNTPVFGCEAALVPDEQRVAVTKDLMKKVFAYARERGLDIVFALDVDTASSNPPNIISTLPESARFSAKGSPLADPDTPEGFAYYRAQVESLFSDYPQISRLVIWFRHGGTPWRTLAAKDLPKAWLPAYKSGLERNPGVANDKNSPSMFAIAKVTEAFRRGLKAIDRPDVRLSIGTWHPEHMPAANAFQAPDIAFLWLDYAIKFDSPGVMELNKRIAAHRSVIPIVWAHHDDSTYVGRSYTPFPEFASKLQSCGAKGFGVIHWTTRPLDLYFKSLSEQTWTRSRDEALAETCRNMAARLFGQAQREKLGEYLLHWVTKGPQFGRETSDRFIDHKLSAETVIAASKERQGLLDGVNASALSPTAREHLMYFKGLERFFVDFHRDEAALQQSIQQLKAGNLEAARTALQDCHPESTIEAYRTSARHGRISKGEEAIIISLNLRWLPYFVAQRQSLGLEAVRVSFRPTQHDPLAQGAGSRSFFFDAGKNLWNALGTKETGFPTHVFAQGELVSDPARDIGEAGILCEKAYEYASPVLPAGSYRLRVFMRDLTAGDPAKPPIEITLKQGNPKNAGLDSKTASAGTIVQHGNGPTAVVEYRCPVELTASGKIEALATPTRGKAVLCGLMIVPVVLDKDKSAQANP